MRRRAATAAATCVAVIFSALVMATGPAGAAEPDSLETQPTFDLEQHGSKTETSSEIDWITPEAAADSVAAFWGEMDRQWDQSLPSDLVEFQLDAARIDSLTEVGRQKVTEMLAGNLWRTDWVKVSDAGFNRVEGTRLETGLHTQRLGPTGPDLELSGGYCFSSKRLVGSAELSTVLKLKRPVDLIGRPTDRPWPLLAVELSGAKETIRYAGDNQKSLRQVTAAFYGSDPGRYYERHGGAAGLVLRPWRRLALRAGFLAETHESLSVVTTRSFFGEREDVDDNPAITGLSTRALTLDADWAWRHFRLEAGAQWHRVTDSPVEGDYRRWNAGLSWNHVDRWGDELLVRGHWQSWDRNVPAQWKIWLGDTGTLRGFEAREIAGDQAVWGSVDLRCGRDIFRDLHIPLLKKFGLQPIAFVDWGRAVALDGPSAADAEEGWRADAGIGLGTLLGLPHAGGYLRGYVSRPVFGSEGDSVWRIVLAFEN